MQTFLRTTSITCLLLAAACGGDDGAMPGTDAGPSADGGRTPDATTATDAGVDAEMPPVDPCGALEPDYAIDPALGGWDTRFVLPGARTVNDVATGPDGALTIGGAFEHVSGVTARNIAQYGVDGRVVALGDGLPSAVSAVAVSPSGDVYAATGANPVTWSLSDAGARDASIARIYRYEASAWTEIGRIDGGAVFGLAADGAGRLYAVGDFFEVSGVSASHFAVWQSGTWSEGRALSAPAVAVYADAAGACFAGNVDDGAGGERMMVACGTPGAFVELPLPADFSLRFLPAGFGLWRVAPPIAVIERDAGRQLLIGGNFTFGAFAEGLGSVARWETDHWEPLGGGVGYAGTDFSDWGVVEDLAVDADGAIVVGGDYIRAGSTGSPEMYGLARYTGTAWEDIPSARLDTAGIADGIRVGIGRISRLARAGDAIAVVAGFSRIEGVSARSIALYDDGAYAPLRTDGTPTLGLDGEVHAITARASCGPYVAGVFRADGMGTDLPFLARWTGDAWAAVAPEPPGPITALALAPNADLFALVKPFAEAAFADQVHVVRDGAITEIGRAESSDPRGGGASLIALAVAPDGTVYAAGQFSRIGGVDAAGVAAWDGTAWHALGTGIDGWIEAITVTPEGDLVAVGRFTEAGGVAALNVARWDGAAWSALGEGNMRPLSGVTVWQGDVVVSAYFDGRGGETGPLVARWDGTAWEDLSSSDFRVVEGSDTELVAAGETLALIGQLPLFDEPGRSAKAALYRGGTWVPLESSTADIAYAAALHRAGLWIGGSFTVVADVPADQIALFQLELPD